MSFMSDADRPRRTQIIDNRIRPNGVRRRRGGAPAGAAIPVNPGTVRIEPQRRCQCTLARGVWLDKFGGARCDICNLKIRDWEKS